MYWIWKQSDIGQIQLLNFCRVSLLSIFNSTENSKDFSFLLWKFVQIDSFYSTFAENQVVDIWIIILVSESNVQILRLAKLVKQSISAILPLKRNWVARSSSFQISSGKWRKLLAQWFFFSVKFLFWLLRGQTVHCIGAQFCVCMFLDSRDKSLNMWKICRNNQRKWMNKRRKKGASLLQNLLTFSKKHTWPRNEPAWFFKYNPKAPFLKLNFKKSHLQLFWFKHMRLNIIRLAFLRTMITRLKLETLKHKKFAKLCLSSYIVL